MATESYTYEQIKAVADHISSLTPLRPTVGIICTTVLGALVDEMCDRKFINYNQIPDFPISKDHKGQLVIGCLEGKEVIVMRGRIHHYEGYPMWKVVLPVRVMQLLGVRTLLVTNAAGGLNPEYGVGDIMVIKDHIDMPGLSGQSALTGPHDERLGPRFLTTAHPMYDEKLRQLALKTGKTLGHDRLMKEGTYVLTGGPTFTTGAETRLLKAFGADAIGMSTVPEVVAVRHAGMRVLGMSLITQNCNRVQSDSHEVVMKEAQHRARDMRRILIALFKELN